MGQRLKRGLPVLAVAVTAWIGARVIARAITRGGEDSGSFRLAAVWSGREFHSRADRLWSGSALALMGGIKIDLRDATVDPAGATLDLRATMGGIELAVPEDWAVDFEDRSIAGGLEARVTAREVLPEDAPTLHVRARSVMGGILVTVDPDAWR